MSLSSEQIESFRKKIWSYFREHGRNLPWRSTTNPYEIMVSEFMLQQTQVSRVAEKYGAWLRRFPTVQSVAEADLSDVLSEWNGLGYNRRAKFLYESCRMICSDYGGVVPCTADELDALPGVGAYTARAIAAFAFGKAEAFVETNIRAVFIHFFFSGGTADAVPDSDILPLVEATLDRSNPKLWYYALMDYGAGLKRQGENPTRKSKSYAKQSAFAGSQRQARGAILRQLAKNPGQSLSLDEIAAEEGIDLVRLSDAAESLLREGMVQRSDGRYRLGNG